MIERKDIPNSFPIFTRTGITIHWDLLEDWIERHNVDLNPPYQRWYVWNEEQKIAYIEYILRGGISGRTIIVNLPNGDYSKGMECIDGQQRIKTVLSFIKGDFKVFNNTIGFSDLSLSVLNDLFFLENQYRFTDKKDIVNVYIWLNTGGSIHTKEDIKIAEDYLKTL